MTATATAPRGPALTRLLEANPDLRHDPTLILTLREARAIQRDFYAFTLGRGPITPALLTAPSHNVKLLKSLKPTYGLSLAPASLSGFNTCLWSTPQCRALCLNTAGKGTLAKVQRGRIDKTRFLAAHPIAFLRILQHELLSATLRHPETGINFRANVLADLRWDMIAPWLFHLPLVTVYDYTKERARFLRARNNTGGRWHLTFSASESTTDATLATVAAQGANTTVVFASSLPATYRGFPVINGDSSDDRTLDPQGGVIVGLKAKGYARTVAPTPTGFVRIP